MRFKTAAWICLTACLVCGIVAERAFAQETSTPEERAKWAVTTHQLEVSPFDESANKDADAAIQRIAEVRDLRVFLCMGVYSQFKALNYTYQQNILRQYMLASAAFQIENPNGADNLPACSLYAVESILKLYQAILAQKPDAKSQLLDDLLKKQKAGKLESTINKLCK
jgi:hypothetical protein